jgi:hypothetical protein
MSFDLFFYKKKDNRLSEADIAAYLSKHIVTTDREFGKQWIYENQDTKVYFTVEWNNPDDEDEEVDDNYQDFANTNFSFSVNYFRPNFFGLETFPLIYQLIEALDLYVDDLQQKGGEGGPRKYTEAELFASWTASNEHVTQGQHKQYSLEYLPLENSNYLWQYQYLRPVLEARIQEDIYIPNLMIVKERATGLLYTACAWTTHIPLVLPKVDLIFIMKKYKKLFSSVEEQGALSYEAVMNELGAYFEPMTESVSDLKILYQANADKLAKKFNALKIDQVISDFTGVDIDNIVNIPPK